MSAEVSIAGVVAAMFAIFAAAWVGAWWIRNAVAGKTDCLCRQDDFQLWESQFEQDDAKAGETA